MPVQAFSIWGTAVHGEKYKTVLSGRCFSGFCELESVFFFEAYGEAFRLSILINEYFGLDAFLLYKMVFM